jgi:MIP family channel proteins
MTTKKSSGWKLSSNVAREFLAEFLGTFVLVLFGDASIAQAILSLGSKGDFFAINWGWGLAVILGVLVSGGVSGGHINPAVTVAVATLGKFPWWKVPHYLAGQYLGAFAGATVVFFVYWDAIVWYEHDRGAYRSTPDTAGIFSTYPSPHLTTAGGAGDQFLGTAMLMLCVCAITDRKNMQVSKQMVPLFIGFTVLAIGICFGYNCGYAINPARDLAPRLFTALAGWGTPVFTYPTFYWWVIPIVATHVGAIVGAWIYFLAIELNWPNEETDSTDDEGSSTPIKSSPSKNGGKGPTYIQCEMKDVYPPDEFQDETKYGPEKYREEKYRALPTKAAFQDELKKTVNK